MKKLLLSAVLTLSLSGITQEIHEHPDHPKGLNSADQYEALPLYNEACELYAKGRLEGAKISLYEAINTSFALTEAQLFLAKILYEQNKLDSAMIYFNSGIDFAVEQDPHHYFYYFETGMKMGQYDQVKHNQKAFKKLYGDLPNGQYESDYPFTVDDFQLYQRSLALVTDYNYWEPKATILDTLKFNQSATTIGNNELLIIHNDEFKRLVKKKKGEKVKKWKGDLPAYTDIQFPAGNEYAFFTKNEGHVSSIWFAVKEGKKWLQPIQLPEEINTGTFNGNPYYVSDKNLLYFSSDRNGSKDLFVAKLDLENNKVEDIVPLDIINTPNYDEINPVLKSGSFYFSSNGHANFGGFDLFESKDLMTLNGIVTPRSAINMGKPFNTNKDEFSIDKEQGQFIIERSFYTGQKWFIRMNPLQQEDTIYYEIKKVDLSEHVD
ncbi:PD40 domain-containing protein [Crocinitomix catalasitica]|uniref:PD40 domain-containing protein n=1 Tax=Crocinitomix catalasitica TaxID=184607 RepID=UPI00048606EF|nr:PD40 domain-containing protein [Crocinitomix catalasitica]